MSQNTFELITDDQVEYNIQHMKSQLVMALIHLIRRKGWSQVEAARELKISAPRMSNLFQGHLEKFSIDTLLELLVRLGYKLDTDFDTENAGQPLVMAMKKVMP